jgi:putative ABC transport system permease protein
VTTTLERPPLQLGTGDGGVAARRAVVRWAWRLFRREWRQQFLILALVVVAVGATVVGAAVAVNTPTPVSTGFGTAQDLGTFQMPDAHLGSQIAQLRQRFGPVDVIENETIAIPGSINTYDLRAQDPQGAFGQPMLSLLSGGYPTGSGQVAVTEGLVSLFDLKIGDNWTAGGATRRVVGILQNPQNLLDEFALVAPGQVSAPTQVTVLFDAPGVSPSSLGSNFQTPASVSSGNPLNPETIVLTLATLGMLLIGLVAVGGFTVLAQRRMRSIGMLGSLGATDDNIRLVVRANGAVVGIVGAFVGAALGLLVWVAYRPHLETSAHHLIGIFALPWAVIVPAMVLAVVATFFAASRPARAVTRVPIVTALSGRPAPPKEVHRSAVPGIMLGVIAFLLLSQAGADSSNGGGGSLVLVLGFVALIAGVILLSPLSLEALARLFKSAPIAVRMAVRDLARYRARSGSALAAISLGVLIAVIVCVLAGARYGNVLDWAGPNLTSNQLVVNTPSNSSTGIAGTKCCTNSPVPSEDLTSSARQAQDIAAALGNHDVVQLETTSATLQHAAQGRQFNGTVYVATPQLLGAFGIKSSEIDPDADVLTMRPGLATMSEMQLIYGNYFSGNGPPGGGGPNSSSFPCPASECVANPKIQQVDSLPAGTAAPNIVITEHAVNELHLQVTTVGWFIQTAQPLTASQLTGARLTAAAAGMTLQTKSDQPSSTQVLNWATAFGILLALGILAMTLGLIRSETAGDLRTLAATGASASTRRTITAATAAALGLLGAVLGTVAGYLAVIAFSSRDSLDGISSLGSVPVKNLLVILIGMPAVAAAVGWLLAGREPLAMAQQPLE